MVDPRGALLNPHTCPTGLYRIDFTSTRLSRRNTSPTSPGGQNPRWSLLITISMRVFGRKRITRVKCVRVQSTCHPRRVSALRHRLRNTRWMKCHTLRGISEMRSDTRPV
uniref:Uncharacterized protein n=1 Tax=Cacopsylla melanoneura TaxID=428564 RepID=A0A8D9AIA3_9HEMI